MFDSPKTKLLKLLLKRIEQYHDIGNETLWGNFKYNFIFEGYDIYLEYDSYWKSAYSSFCRKDGINLCDNKKDLWFYANLASIINQKKETRDEIREKKRKAEEEIHTKAMLEKYEEYIQELNGIEKVEGTKEFDEVIEDTKRLREISKEAQQIHDKYKKPFFNLF